MESIDQITASLQARYGSKPYVSRREKYIDAWVGTESKYLTSERVEPVELTFAAAKLALWTQMKKTLEKSGKEFYIAEQNKTPLNNMLHAMTGSVEGDYNPGKGLYVYGPYSSGKTWIMEQICRMVNAAHLTGWYTNAEKVTWYSYKTDIMMRARREKDIAFMSDIFSDKKVIVIDDIGYENDSELMLWGNRENIIVHLVDILYKCYLKGATVHFTSNIQIYNPKEDQPCMMKKYGEGTHDRLMEMCTKVRWHRDINLRTQK